MADFRVVRGSSIKTILSENPQRSIDMIEAAYLAHHDGETINPDSYFLKFSAKSPNRIIALPASINADINVSGIKWIASFPENIKNGIPRASAVLVLNDQSTGYPFALLEASFISSSRTAASAVLAAYWLNERNKKVDSLAFVGAGVIARNIFDMFIATGWDFERIIIKDFDKTSSHAFSEHIAKSHVCELDSSCDVNKALNADILVFATNAATPHISPPHKFLPNQIILNISLRDISPDLILNAVNLFDDVDHCLKANTSPHLAEQSIGNRSFVTGTLANLIRNEITIDRSLPLIFSPFGMGILDLALGKYVFDEACSRGLSILITDFFAENERW